MEYIYINPKEVYTIKELAGKFGVCKNTIRNKLSGACILPIDGMAHKLRYRGSKRMEIALNY